MSRTSACRERDTPAGVRRTLIFGWPHPALCSSNDERRIRFWITISCARILELLPERPHDNCRPFPH